ncbi:MAG: zf-HC2 domain-containing protein [Gammaproteobacteria bacterium]|nr:zf-HC2 domain-containing protein [Gammaproteobacteria bacterium]
MPSCRESTRLMSEARERALTRGERVGLRLHLLMCAGCRNFGKHLDFLRGAAQAYVPGAAADDEAANPDSTSVTPESDAPTGR